MRLAPMRVRCSEGSEEGELGSGQVGVSRGNRPLLNGGWDVGSVPMKLPGQSPNAICPAGPWKNILLQRLWEGPEGSRPLARSGAGLAS